VQLAYGPLLWPTPYYGHLPVWTRQLELGTFGFAAINYGHANAQTVQDFSYALKPRMGGVVACKVSGHNNLGNGMLLPNLGMRIVTALHVTQVRIVFLNCAPSRHHKLKLPSSALCWLGHSCLRLTVLLPHMSNLAMYSTKHFWYARVTPAVPGTVSPHPWYWCNVRVTHPAHLCQSTTWGTQAVPGLSRDYQPPWQPCDRTPELHWQSRDYPGITNPPGNPVLEHLSYTGSPGNIQGLPTPLATLCYNTWVTLAVTGLSKDYQPT